MLEYGRATDGGDTCTSGCIGWMQWHLMAAGWTEPRRDGDAQRDVPGFPFDTIVRGVIEADNMVKRSRTRPDEEFDLASCLFGTG